MITQNEAERKTLEEVKSAYYDAMRAEIEAWDAYSVMVDKFEAGKITYEELKSFQDGCEGFIAAKNAAYTELQAWYNEEAACFEFDKAYMAQAREEL